MTNGNHSAYPLTSDLIDKKRAGQLNNAGEDPATGLTKRESIAAIVLQGLMANEYTWNNPEVVRIAINRTDKLIQQLNITT